MYTFHYKYFSVLTQEVASKRKQFANYCICIKHPFIELTEQDNRGTNSLSMKTKEEREAAVKTIHQTIMSQLSIAFCIVQYKAMSPQELSINAER